MSGLDLERESARIVLNGVSAYARFETTLNADGSFNFTRLPQETYIPMINLQDLVNAGLLDASFNNTRSGFNYSLIAVGSEYAAAALPASSATGRYGFYSVADGVIRYSTFESLAPSQQGGKPVQ